MRKVSHFVAILLVLCMSACAVYAESITFSGIVIPAETVRITAPIGGTLNSIHVKAGDRVTAGTVMAELDTTKVYAAAGGTVTAVYGQSGDDAESVGTQYGGCVYLEGELLYTINGSTSNAYNAAENKIIHSGETVYLRGRSDPKHIGKGIVTIVTGNSYTVNVTDGNDVFTVNESLDIFRTEDFQATSRIGRGSIAKVDPTPVTATGTIVSFAVKPGDRVSRGDLLMETAEGTFDHLQVTGTELQADQDLIVAEIAVAAGAAVTRGETVITAYPVDKAMAEITVNECDLMYIQPGDPVTVELVWNLDTEIKYEGTVTSVSYIGEIGEESTTYKAYVEFTPDEGTRFNMTAEVAPRTDETAAEETPEE